jgi:hypothetical protein
VELEHPPCRLVVLLRERKPVSHGDAPDDQYAVVVLDLADGVGFKAVRIDVDSARLQRTRVRARQSAPSGRHHVVERGRARRHRAGLDAVVLGDLVVDPESDRPLLRRQVGEALRAALAGDTDT